jgi:hypothetical protein
MKKEESKRWYIVLGILPELNLTLLQVNSREGGTHMREQGMRDKSLETFADSLENTLWGMERALLSFISIFHSSSDSHSLSSNTLSFSIQIFSFSSSLPSRSYSIPDRRVFLRWRNVSFGEQKN